jgi:hypothetical protein
MPYDPKWFKQQYKKFDHKMFMERKLTIIGVLSIKLVAITKYFQDNILKLK